MPKIAKNQDILTLESTQVKPVNLKFLYEFASIPLSVRKNYLNKLITCPVTGVEKKNAHRQKNVRLLKIIYRHLTENIMLRWNENIICEELNISRDMLYCHKFWLLKGLRSFYFKWNEPEIKKRSHIKEETLSLFSKAEKMFAIGMKREAKNIFLRIVNLVNSKAHKNNNDRTLLFNLLEYLCNYYMYSRKYREFTRHYNHLESLSKIILKKQPEMKPRILTGLYLCRSYKTNFYGNKTTSTLESIQYIKYALREARSSGLIVKQAHILCHLTGLLIALGRKEECLRYVRRGLMFAGKHNLEFALLFFEILSDLINVAESHHNYEGSFSRIRQHLDAVNNIPPGEVFWKQKILFALTSLSTEIGSPLTSQLLYRFTSREIIYNGYDSALRLMYFMKFDYYFARIKNLKLRNDFVICRKADADYLKKLDTAVFELIINAKKIRDVPFKKELYTFMLITDFWKGKNCSFEYSRNIMRHIDWLHKSSPGLKELNKETLDNTFLGITVISESRYLQKEIFLKKYETKILNMAQNILSMPVSKALSFYYTLSFITENTGYDELKEVARKTFFKLRKKYPYAVKEAVDQLKQNLLDPQYEIEEMAA